MKETRIYNTEVKQFCNQILLKIRLHMNETIQ